VIEHVQDEHLAMTELARILKIRGKIAVTVPTLITEHLYDQLSFEYFRTPGGHIRKVTPSALASSMEENGLSIYAVGFAHAFHSPYWMLRCIFGLHDEKAVVPDSTADSFTWLSFPNLCGLRKKSATPSSQVHYSLCPERK